MWRSKVAGTAVAITTLVPMTNVVGPGAYADEVGSAKVVPLQITGDPAKRFNLVILGDGYTEADMPSFRAQADEQMSTLFAFEPWKSYSSYVNVYRVDIVSGESGVSCDPSLSSPRRTTPLSMGFWGGCNASSVQRLLTVNSAAAARYADMVPSTSNANRQILAIGNSRTYGGAGGTYATASGGNALSALIMPHEIGHSLGGLQDEYNYLARGVPGGAYQGGEPSSIHHTLLTEQQMKDQKAKWWRWLGEKSESGGVIGRYEGGMYNTTGVWRPSAHSMMKTLAYAHDQIQTERMTQAISAKVNLLQEHTPTTAPIGSDRAVWLETLHPTDHALTIRWTLDGEQVARDTQNLDLGELKIKPGVHNLTATVADPTSFVRDPAIRASAALTQTRTWTVDTKVRTPDAPTAPGFTNTTDAVRPVRADSVIYAETTHHAKGVHKVRWKVDGHGVDTGSNDRDLDLGDLSLSAGTHTVTATAFGRGAPATRTWKVDAVRPTAGIELSQPVQTEQGRQVFEESFTMKLTPADDEPGAVLAEFQVDGDGWYRYYGWPTDSTKPFMFTPLGTNIDDLYYGKIGPPARAVAWEQVPPGYGPHTIEYRAIDAAGNVGRTQRVLVDLRKKG